VCAFSEVMCLTTAVHNKQSYFLFGIVLVNIGSNFFRVLIMLLANICLGFVVLLIVCLVKSDPTLFLLVAFAKLRKATISFFVFYPSFRPPAWNTSAATGRVFIKFGF
jgi:hypothetical protein